MRGSGEWVCAIVRAQMSENGDVRKRWVFGLAIVGLAIALGVVLDVPAKLNDAPAKPSGPESAVTTGCRSSCEAKGSSASFCRPYCACVLERLEEGRSQRELSQFLLTMAKDPSAEQLSEMESNAEACAELARSTTAENP